MKSADIKEKLVEYITNPNGLSTDTDRHVSSSDKMGKPYRNLAPIFSIDEDHEPNGNNEDMTITNAHELIKLSAFLENPRIVTYVKCQEVTVSGYLHDWWVQFSSYSSIGEPSQLSPPNLDIVQPNL